MLPSTNKVGRWWKQEPSCFKLEAVSSRAQCNPLNRINDKNVAPRGPQTGTVLVLQRSVLSLQRFTASTLLASLNRSSMYIIQVRLSETWMPRSFTVSKWSSFWFMMLKSRSLPLKVFYVHFYMVCSILFFLTPSVTPLSRSSCVSQNDFLIDSTFKLSLEMNGSEKVTTSGRSIINMQNSNKLYL